MATFEKYLNACTDRETDPVEFEAEVLSGDVPAKFSDDTKRAANESAYFSWLITKLKGR